MLRFRNALITVTTIAIVGLFGALTPAGHAIAQDARALLVEVVSPVTIGNAPSNPVPILDIYSSARHVFRAHFVCQAFTYDFCSESMTVPAGKLLVIETFSADCTTDTITPAARASITIPQSVVGGPSEFFFPLVSTITAPVGYTGLARHFNTTAAVRLYADPGTEIRFGFHKSPAGSNLICEASISGLITDCGAGSCAIP
jgi:hypothetical protein